MTMAVCASAIASAADFPVAQPVPPPPPELRGTISSGIYLRGDIGVSVTNYGDYNQADITQFGGVFVTKEDRSNSYFAGVGVGYRFNNWFRVDGTLEYRGGATIGATDVVFNPFIGGNQTNTYKGNLSSIVALFNAYVDLGTWNCLTPYIGAGIGYATNRITGLTDQGLQYTGLGTLGTAGTGDKSGMAWALMSAAALAPIALRAAREWRPELVREWQRTHARIIGRRQRVCRGVSRVLRSPFLTGIAVRALSALPLLARPVTVPHLPGAARTARRRRGSGSSSAAPGDMRPTGSRRSRRSAT